MSGLSELIHRADFPFEKKFGTRGETIHVRRGKHRNAARHKKSANVTKKSDRAFDVFDDLNGSDQPESCETQLRREIGLVEIQRDMRNIRFKALGIGIHRKNLPSRRAHTSRHGTRAGAKIRGAHSGLGVPREHTFTHRIVQAVVCRGVNHRSFIAADTSRYTRLCASIIRLLSQKSSARPRAAWPRTAPNDGSSSKRESAAAKSRASPTRNTRPVLPSSSVKALRSEATTGSPLAMFSATTNPKTSPPSEGTTTANACARADCSCSPLRRPAKRTCAPI